MIIVAPNLHCLIHLVYHIWLGIKITVNVYAYAIEQKGICFGFALCINNWLPRHYTTILYSVFTVVPIIVWGLMCIMSMCHPIMHSFMVYSCSANRAESAAY